MKRKHEIKIRLTDKELDSLMVKVKKSGLSREGYIRKCFNASVIREVPPIDAARLIMEVRRVGINIDQILKFANINGYLDVPRLRKALEQNRELEEFIFNIYVGEN